MNVYLDASAAMKLVRGEAETTALEHYLDEAQAEAKWSSRLIETELRRAVHRLGLDQWQATQVLDRLELFDLDRSLFQAAGLLPGPHLGSLDALHIATALETEMDVVLTYDLRMQRALDEVGLRWEAPN